MSAAASSKLAQRLSTIAKNWVRDPFRPNLQLSTFLNSLAQHPHLTPKAVHAARVLQNGDLQKAYPLSDKTLRPPSMPQHYERLLEGYQKSQQGIGRPWWKVFFGIW